LIHIEILSIQKVTKNFGELKALDAVDVTLNEGAILGMIGPNGSGKTTLFNVISGIYAPASGEVRYKGEKITRKKPHFVCRLGIARTFQVVQPFLRMTVLENVTVSALHGRGLGLREGREKATQVLEFVGLKEKIHSLPDNITTPDRRRLELARALATEPEVILLDETMAGLTPAEIEGVLDLLREMNQRGITIFMVEHIMRAVMTLCERIIVLNYGRKIAEGTPEEVADNKEVIKAYLGDRYV
jgi:branched-chain amino acid transport system ATP-binding protein